LTHELSQNLIFDSLELLGSLNNTSFQDYEMNVMFYKILLIGYKYDFTKLHQYLRNSFKFDISNLMVRFDIQINADTYWIPGIDINVDKKNLRNIIEIIMEIAL